MKRLLLVALLFVAVACEEEPVTGTVSGHEYDDWDDTSGYQYEYDLMSGEYEFRWVNDYDPAKWYLHVTTDEGKSVRVKVSESLHDSCVVGQHYAMGQCE